MKVISATCHLVVAIASVVSIHTGAVLAQPAPSPDPAAVPAPAQAQQVPPPPPSAYPQEQGDAQQGPPADSVPPGYEPPPGYGPPPGYAPPRGYVRGAPPRGYGQPPPRYSYYPPPPPPPPPRLATERPFMIGGSLGLGVMRYRDIYNYSTSGQAAGYSARLGFGLGPRLLLLIGIEGAVADGDYTADPQGGSSVYDQTVYYVGLQHFLTRQLFLRGGVGMGNIRDNYGFFHKTGLGLTAGVGVELLQGYNWSLELAGQLTSGFYKDQERWTSGTVNIGFNFF